MLYLLQKGEGEAMNYHLMNPLQKLLYHIRRFFVGLPGALGKFFKTVGAGIVSFFTGIGRGVADYCRMFWQGDIFTKLSYVIMGFGAMVRGQIIKGALYLVAECSMVVYVLRFGWQYLKDIGTLGVNAEVEYLDEATGLIMYKTADNSMLILLYSVMSLILIAAFLYLYFSSVRVCYNAEKAHARGEKLPSFLDDCKALFDRDYHKTMLALPTLLAVAFVVLPLVFMVLIAFTNYDKSHQPPGNLFTWVGLQNFRDIFGDDATKSKTFSYLLKWTFTWAVAATFTNYLFGMILALLINKKGIRFKKMWRTIFIITIAVPQFVSLLLMSKLFGDQGPVNLVLQQLGWINSPIPFLTNGTYARWMCIIINMWVGIPYSMLITTGILMNIPNDLYESARIDGAGPVKAFLKITLPYMLFVTTPYLITQFVGNFNNFNVIYLLTLGDPKSVWLYQAGETDLLVTWLYKLTVNQQDYNVASVIGIIVFVISAVLSLIVYNSSGSVKKEEEFQ